MNFNAGVSAPGFTVSYSNAAGAPGSWNGRAFAPGVDGSDGLPTTQADPRAKFDQFGNLFVTYFTSGLKPTTLFAGALTGNINRNNKTLGDTNGNWTPNEWQGWTLQMTSGKEMGQRFTIASNTTNQLTLTQGWDPTVGDPAVGDTFDIISLTGASLVVAISSDGGKTFQLVTNTAVPSSPSIDYPTIATGPGPNGSGTPESLWIAYATNQGVFATGAAVNGPGLGKIGKFVAPVSIVGSQGGYTPDISVGLFGQTVVAYMMDAANQGQPPTIMVASDPNGLGGAQGFSEPIPVTTTTVINS